MLRKVKITTGSREMEVGKGKDKEFFTKKAVFALDLNE